MTGHKNLKIVLAFVLILPALVVAVWLPNSPVDLAPNTSEVLGRFFACVFLLLAITKFVDFRLASDQSAIASKILHFSTAISLICLSVLGLLLSNIFMLPGGYLGASLAFPLYDDFYAGFSRTIGFDWLAAVSWINTYPFISKTLQWAYASTFYQTPLLLIFLACLHQKDRLLEYVSLYAMTGFVTLMFAIFLPAWGAYVFYQPEAAQFSNLGATPGTWHMQITEALRSGQTVLVNFTDPEGIVTFPSFHTILAIITTYSARHIRFVFPVMFALNGWVIVSTIPVGGHYLIDLIAAGAISWAVIRLVSRLMDPVAGQEKASNTVVIRPFSQQA